jgi:hypothetical protein
MGKKTTDPEIMELARVSCEEVYDQDTAEMLRRVEEEPDIEVSGPPIGTYAFTARMMAGPNPTQEEAEFWDRWKDEMKEGLY